MIAAILLAASFAFADGSTDTAKTQDSYDQGTRISNLAKDVRELQSGQPKITGKPRYLKGFCFNQAGTDCQTTAPAASVSWTGAGYVVGSSVGISGAASTLISGLDGNTDKNWRIQIDGLIATAGSNSFIKIRPNSDAGANYQGIQNSDYSGATTRNAWSAGMYAGELLSNTAESIHSTFWVHSSTATNLKRCGHLLAGFSDTGGEQGETHGGGCWTNTTDNITSLNIIWANTSFTGTVTVYRD